MAKKALTIGIEAEPPTRTCDDVKCPWHGSLRVRGRIFEGRVVSTKMNHSVVVRRDYKHLVRKYDRYETRKGMISAHQPHCIDLKEGDWVRAMECRPLSKSISFVVIEKLNK